MLRLREQFVELFFDVRPQLIEGFELALFDELCAADVLPNLKVKHFIEIDSF